MNTLLSKALDLNSRKKSFQEHLVMLEQMGYEIRISRTIKPLLGPIINSEPSPLGERYPIFIREELSFDADRINPLLKETQRIPYLGATLEFLENDDICQALVDEKLKILTPLVTKEEKIIWIAASNEQGTLSLRIQANSPRSFFYGRWLMVLSGF